MHAEVTNVQIITCITTAVVCFITLWIVQSAWKMYAKQQRVASSFYGNIEDATFTNCGFESVAEEIYDAAKKSDCLDFAEKCVNLLRIYPEYINTPVSRNKFTPFLRACWTGSTSVVKYMLQNGADVSLRTSAGESALFLAAHTIAKNKFTWNPTILCLLHKSGCCVNARREHGYSPLHIAAEYGNTKLVGWLLAHGADPSATTICGVQPIDLAYYNGYKNIVEMLTICVDDNSYNTVIPDFLVVSEEVFTR